jgi:hypothetical protein
MNAFSMAYKSFFKEVTAQYGSFGYSDVWSDLGYDGPEGGVPNSATTSPMGRLDLDMAERVQPWSKHVINFAEEWGTHKGNRAWGSDFFIAKKLCPDCNGYKFVDKNSDNKKEKCERCKGKGYIKVKYRYSKTNPELDGRLKQQLRYRGEPYWPHNRDVVRTEKEVAQSYDEWYSGERLGKPH